MIGGFFTVGGAADFGWVAYAPLSERGELARRRRRTCGSSALMLTGFSAIFTGVNIVDDGLLPACAGHDDVPACRSSPGTCW